MARLSVEEAKQVAVSYHLLAYAHGISDDDRKSKRVILVESFVKKNDSGERAKLVKNIDDGSRPTTIPEQQEFDFSDEADPNQTAVWVGMYSPITQTAATKEGNEKNKKMSNEMKGKCVLDISKGDVYPHDPNALRVVCPRFRKTATCYALISQNAKSGLCVGSVIDMEDVFFFPEYRDDELLVFSQRKAVWAGKVRDALGLTEQAKRDAARTYDKTKFLVGKQRSLQNEIQQLGGSRELTGERTYLDTTLASLKELAPDLKDDKMAANQSLRAFIDAQSEPTDAMCKEALGEISQLWPAVHEKLNVDSLMAISWCIRAANISVPWPLVRMFIVEMDRSFQYKYPTSDEDAASHATNAMNYLELLGAAVNSKAASVTPDAKFSETEAKTMEKHADLIQQRDEDEPEPMEE